MQSAVIQNTFMKTHFKAPEYSVNEQSTYFKFLFIYTGTKCHWKYCLRNSFLLKKTLTVTK